MAADLHVVLVGLDEYGSGIPALSGPTSDVVRYARWAIESGRADPFAVIVFASPPDRVADDLIQLGLPPDNIRDGHAARIEDYLEHEMPHRSERDLLVLWSGHGFMSSTDSSRFLFPANASRDQPRGLNVREVHTCLRGRGVSNLDRQLLVFDVCAEVVPAPARQVFVPVGGAPKQHATYRQEALFAAHAGEVVDASRFSSAVLSVLETTAPDEWPPTDAVDQLRRGAAETGYRLFHGDDQEVAASTNLASRAAVDRLGRGLANGMITPIVGGHLRTPFPDEGDLAENLGESENFPFTARRRELFAVMEFLARRHTTNDAKHLLAESVPAAGEEGALLPDLWHVAGLPLPVFLTTAHDSVLEKCMRLHGKTPRAFDFGEDVPADADDPESPIVFHLYGSVDEEDRRIRASVTENEVHLRNLDIATDGESTRLPAVIRHALGRPHMYVGFDLAQPVLANLMRALLGSERARGTGGLIIAPGLGDVIAGADEELVRDFQAKYFGSFRPGESLEIVWDFPYDTFQSFHPSPTSSTPV